MVRLLRATATRFIFGRRERSRSCSLACRAVSESQMKVARRGRRNMAKRERKKRMETGPDSAGQGGATQQISDTPIADCESVEELAEEGNAFEADVQPSWMSSGRLARQARPAAEADILTTLSVSSSLHETLSYLPSSTSLG